MFKNKYTTFFLNTVYYYYCSTTCTLTSGSIDGVMHHASVATGRLLLGPTAVEPTCHSDWRTRHPVDCRATAVVSASSETIVDCVQTFRQLSVFVAWSSHPYRSATCSVTAHIHPTTTTTTTTTAAAAATTTTTTHA